MATSTDAINYLVLATTSHLQTYLNESTSKTEVKWESKINVPFKHTRGNKVNCMSWSPQSSFLAAVGKKWTCILIYNMRPTTMFKEARLRLPESKFQNSCAFNSTGRLLVTSGTTGSIHLFQFNDDIWTLYKSFKGRTVRTTSAIAWSPEDLYICAGDTRGDVIVFKKKLIEETLEFRETTVLACQYPKDEITVLQCNPYYPTQEAEVTAGHNSGRVAIWNVARGRRSSSHVHHKSSVTDIAYSTIKNNMLVTSSLDGTAVFIDRLTGKKVKTVTVAKPIRSIEFILPYKTMLIVTENTMITFPLNSPWQNRIETEHDEHFLLARYKKARWPKNEDDVAGSVSPEKMWGMFEGNSTASGSGPIKCGAGTTYRPSTTPIQCGASTASRSTAPIQCGASTASRRASAAATPKGVDVTALETKKLLLLAENKTDTEKPSPSMKGLTTEQIKIDFSNRRSEISDIAEEEESSFHISDIANYTNLTDEDRRLSHNISEIQSLNKRNQLSPEDNSKVDTSPNKVRKLSDNNNDKENYPPTRVNVATPMDIGVRKSRLVSSTPAVPLPTSSHHEPTVVHHPPNFGTPTSGLAKTVPKIRNTSMINNIPPDRDRPIADSPMSKLSNQLKEQSLTRSENASSLLSPSDLIKSGVSIGSNVRSTVITPEAAGLPPGNNMLSTEQMSIIQNLMKETKDELDRRVEGDSRWVKTEVIKSILATEWNLENAVNARFKETTERLDRLEQLVSEIHQDIRAIRNNL